MITLDENIDTTLIFALKLEPAEQREIAGLEARRGGIFSIFTLFIQVFVQTEQTRCNLALFWSEPGQFYTLSLTQ